MARAGPHASEKFTNQPQTTKPQRQVTVFTKNLISALNLL
jgi:hypothetical protein